MQQIEALHQTKSAPFLEHFCICYKTMVRQVGIVWNHFEASLRVMYDKLARLDFVMIQGEVVYISREEVRDVWL